ncbi:hypothetical protein LINPERPRIM_LOCUS30386 [Linum perenne]
MMLCRRRIEHAVRRKNQDKYVILTLGQKPNGSSSSSGS